MNSISIKGSENTVSLTNKNNINISLPPDNTLLVLPDSTGVLSLSNNPQGTNIKSEQKPVQQSPNLRIDSQASPLGSNLIPQ